MEQSLMGANAAASRVQLGDFVLDLANGELRTANEQLVELRKQALAVLLVLGSHAGHVVSKDELMRRVWPNVVVGEDSLAQAIAEIRRVLGDQERRLLRTVARRGYLLVPDASAVSAAPPSATPHRAVRRWLPIAVTVGLIAAVVIGIALIRPGASGTSASAPLADGVPTRSLVVLPLESEVEEGWFADAVTADLTSTLGRWRNVLVIGRDTARTYKGKGADPRAVARELGVRYVVRGAVRRDGDRVRLDLALVDGESGAQRWAEQIDVERARLAQSIDDLKGGIAKTLVIEVGRSVGERVTRLRPEQVEADDLAMQGFFVFLRGVTREGFLEAREIFERALAKDPNSIRGLAGVSMTNSFGVIMHWMPDREASVRRSEETLARLESIDPSGQLTLMSQASIANMRGDWEGVLLVSKSLLELFPNDPTSHHHRCSALLRLGGFADAIPSCERAIKISPRDSRVPIWHGLMGMNYFMLGQYALAAENIRHPVTASPQIVGYWPVLIAALALDGRRDEAAQVAKELVQRHPGFTHEEIAKRWYGT
ncbi:MAG TPA: winged helix-turn-helix domain-containing protein, partial [Burkholderiaceae bacterium]|nr:winged helix-turn-helix domain-containing protein [Burkholderiaceae bacterium]